VQLIDEENSKTQLNYLYLRDFLKLIAARSGSDMIKTNQINYMFIDLNYYYDKCLNKFEAIELNKNDMKFIEFINLKLISMNENSELDEACTQRSNHESIRSLKLLTANLTVNSNKSAHFMQNESYKSNDPSLLLSQSQYYSMKETKSYLFSMFIKLFIYFACFVVFIFVTLIVLHKINQRNLKKLIKKNAYISALSNQLYSFEIFSSDFYKANNNIKSNDCTQIHEQTQKVQESETSNEPNASINHQIDSDSNLSNYKKHPINKNQNLNQFSSEFQHHKQRQASLETKIQIDDENCVVIVDLNNSYDYKRKINENSFVGELKNDYKLREMKKEDGLYDKNEEKEEEEGDTRSEYSITDLEKMQFVQ
jgi:hypothetical protein